MFLARCSPCSDLARIATIVAFVASVACTGPQQREEEMLEQSDYHYQLGVGHFQAREIPNAIRELLAAVEIRPEYPAALYLLGFIYQGRLDYPEAERYYLATLALEPEALEVKNNLGTIYLAQERWEDAEEIFRALTRTPTYITPGHAHNNLGLSLMRQGRAREAVEQFDMAIMFQPELCLAYTNKGEALESMGVHADAIESYEDCIALSGCNDYQLPRYRLGIMLLEAGDTMGGLGYLAECADIAPSTELGERCVEYLEAAGIH
jgi:Tfp pilus assembly protein PilF